jgi:hypothetical protein
VGAVQRAGERFQFGLGGQWVGEVIGLAHPLGDRGGQRVGQPVGHVAELVKP